MCIRDSLTVAFAPPRSGERRDDRVAAREAELAEVRDHLAALRAEFDAFRADLGG